MGTFENGKLHLFFKTLINVAGGLNPFPQKLEMQLICFYLGALEWGGKGSADSR